MANALHRQDYRQDYRQDHSGLVNVRSATEWTTTPPTEPGWYWAQYKTVTGTKAVTIFLVKEHNPDNELWAFCIDGCLALEGGCWIFLARPAARAGAAEMIPNGLNAARRFRAEFLGRKARSNRTGDEGIICGGMIDTFNNHPGVSGRFELQTEQGKEYNLLITDLVFIVEPPKLTQPQTKLIDIPSDSV